MSVSPDDAPKTTRDRPRIRVAAIIVEQGRILLAQHEKDGTRYWVLPGGGVHFGETLEEALIRELKEEASVDIRVGELVLANDSLPPDRHRHIVNLYFTAEIVGGTLAVGCSDKRLVGVQFAPIEDLPNLTLYPDVRAQVFASLRAGRFGGPHYLRNLWR